MKMIFLCSASRMSRAYVVIETKLFCSSDKTLCKKEEKFRLCLVTIAFHH